MNKCIIIGQYAGMNNDKDLALIISNIEKGKLVEYKTIMTQEEFETVNKVVRRAIENKKDISNNIINK